jgi:hypothetical protein
MSGNDSAEKERLEQERREKADAERAQRYDKEGERRNKDDPDETVIVVKKPDE